MHNKPHTEEAKQKMREARLRNPVRYWAGKTIPAHVRDAQKKAITGKPSPLKGRKIDTPKTDKWRKAMKETMSGSNNPNWVADRTKLVKSEKKHLCTKYKNWMLSVKKRDSWKCRITNDDCKGRLESHHILNWIDYPELRYEINNGITLCHAHHPKGRAKEKQLAPFLQGLVSVSNK